MRRLLPGVAPLPGVGGTATGNPQTGGGGGARDTNPEYDRAFEATAWWSSTDDGGNSEGRLPLDPVPEEESDAASNPRKEMLER